MVALIQTKLHPPPLRPDLVPRERLLERLDDGLARRRKLTLVTAPAGFGKTTLAAAWCRQLAGSPWQTAWVSLDARDRDPLSIFRYAVAALRRLIPTFAPALFRADDSQEADPDIIVQTIVNELAELEVNALLVLDDLHAAATPALFPLLEMLVEYAPTNFHLVLTSRDWPDLPLHRWRARDQMTAVAAVDLRFDRREIDAFLSDTMRLGLPDDVGDLLARRTEGWIAGLQLAALSWGRDGPSAAPLPAQGSDRNVGDYLFAEVLAGQPPLLRRFLLATSLLDRFTPPLCDALLGREDSRDLLSQVEQGNLFLVPLDNQRRWYRYHHLFGELLQEQLREQATPEAIDDLHRRAAHWLAAHDLPDEAIDHALQGHDPALAARLIAARPSQMLWAQGGATGLIAWVKRLPEDALAEFPRIAFLAAAAHMVVGEPQAAQPYLARLAAEPQMAPFHQLLEAIILRNQGQLPRAMVQLREAWPRLPSADQVLHTMAGLQLTVNYYESGLLDEAEELANTLRGQLAVADAELFSPLLQVVGMQGLAALARADLYRAADLYREGIALVAAEGGALHPMVGQMYSGLGDVYLYWNRLDQAEAYFRKTWQLGEESGISDLFSYSAFGLADIAVQRGDQAAMEQYVNFMRRTARRLPAGDVHQRLAAVQAGYALKTGDLAAAVQWADQCGLSLDEGPLHHHLLRWRTLLAIRLAEIRALEAHDLLPQWLRSVNRVLDLVRSSGFQLYMLRLLLLRAAAEDMVGDRVAAAASLQEALAIGAPGGVIRTFLEMGRPLQVLLEYTAQTGTRSRYLRRILLAFAEESGRPSPAVGSSLPEPLTMREEEVLRYVAAGLSNKEIETALVISRNTVRTHLKNLYGKLGASGRVNALRRARELGLLEDTPEAHPPDHPPG